MTVLNSARIAAVSSINVITSTARTADALVTSAYHAADVLETNTAHWALNAKADAKLNAMQASLFRRDDMAIKWAQREQEAKEILNGDPELVSSFEKYRLQIENVMNPQTPLNTSSDEDSKATASIA